MKNWPKSLKQPYGYSLVESLEKDKARKKKKKH